MAALGTGILILAIMQGIILLVLLFRKEMNRLPNRLLGGTLLLLTVHLALVAIERDGQLVNYPHLSKISWVIPTLYGPLILLFTLSVVKVDFCFKRIHLTLFIPFAVYLILLLPYFLMPASQKAAYLSDTAQVLADEADFTNQLTNFLHLGFIAASLIIFHQQKGSLMKYFSNPGRVFPRWLGNFLLVSFIVIALSVASFYSKRYGLNNFPEVYPYHFIILVVMIFWLGYRLFQDQTLITVTGISRRQLDEPSGEQDEVILTDQAIKFQKTGLDLLELKRMGEIVTRYLQEHKPYLNPNLTLFDLSAELRISPRTACEVIDFECGRKFFDLINGYRIKEFKREIRQQPGRVASGLALALNCGFDSKRSLESALKRLDGTSTRHYLLNYPLNSNLSGKPT